MTTLETYQAAMAALSAATDVTRERAQRAAGAAARNLRREEILAMPAGPERSALLAPLGTEPEPVDLLSEEEQILAIYLDRAGPHAGPAQRVIARWAAYNHQQLAAQTEGWTQEAIAGLLATPRCQAVVGALTTFGWGLAASTLSAATTNDHPLATPETVAAYLAAMDAEGALPQQ